MRASEFGFDQGENRLIFLVRVLVLPLNHPIPNNEHQAHLSSEALVSHKSDFLIEEYNFVEVFSIIMALVNI